MDFYNAGMRVPDDVTLLWAEDNWGNVRRLPTPEERSAAAAREFITTSITTAAAQLPVAQHQPDCQNLGPDVAGQTIWRGPDLDRQRRPFQGLRISAGIFHEPGLGHRTAGRMTTRRIHPPVGGARIRPRNAADIADIMTQIHPVQWPPQTGAAGRRHLQPGELSGI
jgi:hypothetical protein